MKLAAADRELILHRYMEAADVELRLQAVRGPKEYGNGMPDVIRDYADAVAAEPERDKKEWSWGYLRREPASAKAISRAEEVWDWTSRYLMGWPRHRACSPRDCLRAFAVCSVSKRSFSGLCKRKGWARTTAYSRVDQALVMVFSGLATDKVIVAPAAIDYAEQVEQFSPSNHLSSGYNTRGVKSRV